MLYLQGTVTNVKLVQGRIKKDGTKFETFSLLQVLKREPADEGQENCELVNLTLSNPTEANAYQTGNEYLFPVRTYKNRFYLTGPGKPFEEIRGL